MVSREMIEIILKAEDQASRVIKDNEKQIKQFGNSAQQANQKAAQSSQMTKQSLSNLATQIKNVSTSTQAVTSKGANQFQRYNKSVQDSIVKFNMLDKETQEWLNRLANSSNPKVFYELNSKCQEAVAKFNALDAETRTWGGSLDYTRSKLQLLGTNTDTLKGKIQVVGNAIPQYLGSKWDSIKGKVSSVGSHITSTLSSALSTVRGKIQSVGDAFSGLGGIISTVFGGIGLKSMADMTVGASINRDRIQQLSYAMVGYGESFESFSNGIWKQMDTMTNSSLVSLDQLSQSASVVKMSTGASKEQMQALLPIINDIGQRAILMGKGGEDAMGLMQAAGKGLNGEFEMLKENFGISKEKLESLGWDGSAKDIDGYTKALDEALTQSGDVNGMMDTTQGKLTKLQKMWSVSGRSLGDDFKPMVDSALDSVLSFVDANNDNQIDDGAKVWAKYAIGAMTAASGFATLAPSISPALQVLDNLTGKTKSALQFLGIMEAEEDALTLATLRESAAQKVSAATKYLSGVATATYGAIVGVLTGEIGLVTAATQVWNAVMAANPIALVVIALAALAVAIYEAGKMFGWWKDVGSMIDAIKTNVMRLWDAFINNPNVQGTIQAIGEAWNWLMEVSKPVIDWLSGIWESIFPESAQGQWDVTRAIIDAIGFSFNLLTIPIKSVYSILQLLYPYLLQFYQGALVPLGNFLTSVFTPVWQLVMSIFAQISPMVTSMSNAFMQFVNGQLPLPGLIQNIFTNLWNIYVTILTNISNAIISWASKIVMNGVNAASRFVSGIVNRIMSLPGRIATYLWNVVHRIVSAGSSWVSNGVNAAVNMVNGVMNQISQLPGRVYTEFMNIGSRIMQAGSDLVNKAMDVGKNIVNGMMNAMGIHSPGIIQENVVGEFVNMISRVGNKAKDAYKTASQLGTAIVDGFGKPELETGMDNLMPNADAVKTQAGLNAELQHSVNTPQMDTAPITESNTTVVTSFKDLAKRTGDAFKTMVDKDKQTYDTIRNNDTTQLNNIRNNLQSNMTAMSNNVRNSMNSMVAKNKSGMNSVKNTTKVQLDNMVTKTKSANQKMIQSWGHMKDGIVSAADKIKSDSTSHFNKLEGTIGSFYRKLQNPGGFGAGPGNGTVSTTRPIRRNGFSGLRIITNAMRKAQLPSFMTLSQMRNNPLVDMNGIGSYITTTGRGNKFSVSDLIRSGTIRVPFGLVDKGNKGAGDWTSGVGNHVSHIKNKSGEWGMKGPKIIGKYATSIGFKVKEFMNGVPNIDFSTFKQIAEDVFSQCHYEFYYDSQKYGNWMTAFQHGGMNCSDSSDALIAMAHACGLPASKVHGHWNKFGHYWANVAGHKMDTTGWMQRRTWTPAASHAGPAPKGVGFDDVINAIIDIFKDDPKPGSAGMENDSSNSGNVTVDGEMKVIHEFVNLPDNITAEELSRLINDIPNDEGWIKKLVKNVVFQKWDLKEKGRLEAKQNRARGV